MANRLAGERSPYLLQHKDNPVDWYPWGPEALGRARAEDKPVFLSIGYSTCHWCHVMEHESFENPAVAEALNRSFVSIKVDREERPDVDDIYMAAVQTMTGSGGWPLSLFLTPEGKPFYGGTYYPPDDRWGRPGFLSLLAAISRAWTERRDELESSAKDLLAHLEASARGPTAGKAPGIEALDGAVADCSRTFDRVHGGFGSAPKFPPSMKLELLLRRFSKTKDAAIRDMVDLTLTRMAEGGMYDQIGGGFHRYSVDERWLVPHFEKMLYDNALLAKVYVFASRELANPAHERIARETLDFLLREMTPPEGGFFAAQDADSEGEEGTFYVWTPTELTAVLGPEAGAIAAARFGVTPAGNFEGGRTVLSVVRSIADLAADFARPESEIERTLADAREKLREARSRRVPPGTDDKLLTDWTALAISAFALAGRILREPRYEKAARAAADRILSRCRPADDPAALLHRERAGEAAIRGFASDYANLVEALLDLYETTFEARYFREAVELQRVLDERFSDPEGGYLLAAEEHDGLVLRPREMMDGATPSSNSVSAMNLLRFHAFTGERKYRERADAIFSRLSVYATRAPSAVSRLLSALDFATAASREVVLAGEIGRSGFVALRKAAFEGALWNRVIAHADEARSLEGLSPLVDGRASDGGAARAWVCEDFACRMPVTEPSELAAALHV